MKVGKIERELLNFYRLAPVGLCENGEVFGCPARESGLLAITVRDGLVTSPIIGHYFTGIDTIDACSLRSASAPLAAAALNVDNSLLLTKNILEQKEPLALKFDGLKGIAYSLLSAQGHIFILTSDGLVILPNLAAEFLQGEPMDRDRTVSWMPVQAIDAFLADDNTVFVIEGEVAIAHKVADLVAGVIDESTLRGRPSNHVGIVPHETHTTSCRPTIPKRIWKTAKTEIRLRQHDMHVSAFAT